MKKVIILAAFFVIAAAVFYFLKPPKEDNTEKVKTASYFVDSTPTSGEVYAAQPINVTLNFSRDLTGESTLSVSDQSGSNIGDGNLKIEDNLTALKMDLKDSLPNGLYKVNYNACFAKGCERGEYDFTIDSKLKKDFTDMRGKKEITVKMYDFEFENKMIIVSAGTKVVWENNGEEIHFVNTETHPEHTYFPQQNSLEIKSGETFSATFLKPGQYNYHCSAHVPQGMLGSIIVSN